MSIPPLLPWWHIKDPHNSAKSAGGRLHLNTHSSLTQRRRSGLTTPLSRHSLGTYPKTSSHANLSWNIRSQSFQLAEPLWTDPDIKSGISVCELILTKKKKKTQAGNKWSNILPKSSQTRKKPPPPPPQSKNSLFLSHTHTNTKRVN